MDGECVEDINNGCSSKCLVCDHFSQKCIECLAGYFGSICEHRCVNCAPRTACSKVHGRCDTCRNGYRGSDCDVHCHEKCATCSRDEHRPCLTCHYNWYGAFCDRRCPPNCANKSCDIATGDCIHGCERDLYHGLKCTELCPAACLNSECDRNGMCSKGCQPGFCGLNCSFLCNTCATGYFFSKTGQCIEISTSMNDVRHVNTSETIMPHKELNDSTKEIREGNTTCTNCKAVSSSTINCDLVSGLCVHGCVDGYYGNSCNFTCSTRCSRRICNQENGSCEYFKLRKLAPRLRGLSQNSMSKDLRRVSSPFQKL